MTSFYSHSIALTTMLQLSGTGYQVQLGPAGSTNRIEDTVEVNYTVDQSQNVTNHILALIKPKNGKEEASKGIGGCNTDRTCGGHYLQCVLRGIHHS